MQLEVVYGDVARVVPAPLAADGYDDVLVFCLWVVQAHLGLLPLIRVIILLMIVIITIVRRRQGRRTRGRRRRSVKKGE